jgi:hypothetical protein
MWVFDLNTLVWKKIEQSFEDDLPASRYFHSADSCTSPSPSPPTRRSLVFVLKGIIISSSLAGWA